MSEHPPSKSQQRLLSLLGAEHDGTYAMAARLLATAEWPGDGLPPGHTWRTAARLSDDELVAALPARHSTPLAVATTADVRAAGQAAWRERQAFWRDRQAAWRDQYDPDPPDQVLRDADVGRGIGYGYHREAEADDGAE